MVEDLAPVGETEELWYMGCTECKKKTCEHNVGFAPIYLASATITTVEHSAQARGIGDVIHTLVDLPAQTCKENTDAFLTEMEALRAIPFNLRFIIVKTQKGEKNALELVFAHRT